MNASFESLDERIWRKMPAWLRDCPSARRPWDQLRLVEQIEMDKEMRAEMPESVILTADSGELLQVNP